MNGNDHPSHSYSVTGYQGLLNPSARANETIRVDLVPKALSQYLQSGSEHQPNSNTVDKPLHYIGLPNIKDLICQYHVELIPKGN